MLTSISLRDTPVTIYHLEDAVPGGRSQPRHRAVAEDWATVVPLSARERAVAGQTERAADTRIVFAATQGNVPMPTVDPHSILRAGGSIYQVVSVQFVERWSAVVCLGLSLDRARITRVELDGTVTGEGV